MQFPKKLRGLPLEVFCLVYGVHSRDIVSQFNSLWHVPNKFSYLRGIFRLVVKKLGDPVSRRGLNETILEFMERGDRTVLLSSHLLDDIERVTDRVLIVVDGRILVNSSVTAFLERVSIWTCDYSDS